SRPLRRGRQPGVAQRPAPHQYQRRPALGGAQPRLQQHCRGRPPAPWHLHRPGRELPPRLRRRPERRPHRPPDPARTMRRLRVHYLTWGEADRPPVVLLHGFGQSAHTWKRVAIPLADRYYLIAPDARGHGDSAWAPDRDYSQLAMRDDAGRLADALKLPRFV